MAAINLLTESIAPKSSFLRLGRLLNSVALVGVVTLLILSSGMIALIVYNNRQLTLSELRQQTLKRNIANLEQTETKFFLLKDRLTKIRGLYNASSQSKEISTVADLVSGVPLGTNVSDVNFTPQEIKVSFILPSSLSLSGISDKLIASGEFKKITLDSFEINRQLGYKASFTLAY